MFSLFFVIPYINLSIDWLIYQYIYSLHFISSLQLFYKNISKHNFVGLLLLRLNKIKHFITKLFTKNVHFLYQKTDNILYKAKQLFQILWKELWTLILSLYRLQEGLYINVKEKLELKMEIIIIFSKIDNNIWLEFNLLSE